jgi:hypothetical protein
LEEAEAAVTVIWRKWVTLVLPTLAVVVVADRMRFRF